jgi:galactofuranose transport system permease protein
LELDAILAVVIGGASLMGGRFSIFLAVIGALVIQTLSVTIILSGIPPKYNLLIKASAILIILLMQSPRFQQQLSLSRFWKKS